MDKVELTSQTNKILNSAISIYTPDIDTLLVDANGTRPYVRQFDVNTNQALYMNQDWERTAIGYSVVLPVANPPSGTANYWVQVDGIKKRVNFSHFVKKSYGYQIFLKGD